MCTLWRGRLLGKLVPHPLPLRQFPLHSPPRPATIEVLSDYSRLAESKHTPKTSNQGTIWLGGSSLRIQEHSLGISPIDGLTTVPPLAGHVAVSASRLERVKKAWVTFYETLKLSLDALRAHKLRSFLTLLGVILAVTVFIVDRFGIITSRDEFIKAQKRPLITMDDYERLRDRMKLARAVAVEEDRNMQIRIGDIIMENTSVMGTTANFADIRLNIAEGRFITAADDEHRSE